MATSSITGTTAVISWTAALNAASYNVQYRVVGAASWSTANTTTASYTITGLSINTNYEWQVQTACTGGGTSSFTSSTTFTTTGLTYCTSVGQTLDGITNVTFNTINNTTSGTSAGYTDYTATQSTTVSTGNAYTLSVKLNTGGNYTNYAKAWIDWNHDGVFSTTTEEYNLGTAVNVTSGATTLSPLSITVPAGAVIGTTRMRVSTQYNAAPSPCTASFDGEVEDYSVIVVAGSGCNAPSGLSTSAISTTGATLGWTAVSGATGYTLQWKLSTATTWTTITGLTTNSYALTGLTAGTAYQFQVSTVCSATSSSAYSSPVSFTTTAAAVCTVPGGLAASAITNTGATLGWSAVSGATGYTLQWKLSTATTWTTITGLTTNSYALTGLTLGTAYQFQVSTVCSSTSSSAYSSPVSFTTTGGTVTYCASHGTTTYEYIKTVALGTINHTVANDGGYGNYTSVSTALTAGTAYTIKLTPGFASGSYTEYWTVYIDYNQDGTLNGTGEVVASGSGTGTGAKSLTFTVPATAKNGATRIRVQMNYGSSSTNPCATLTYGDVHDYTVTISGGTGLQPAGFAAAGQPIHPTADISVYPNPVNTATATVNYSIPSEGSVSMNLVDMYGRVLQSINLGNQSEGAHHYWLNTLDQLKSGHYFIVLYHNNLLAGRNRVVVVHP